ncbi:hypothetical protein Nepgr_021860 [Nepenthes gracilis]|uniref:Polygalacturonase n=1 Tax=Nepenthes gracilis TaxID=150966 RepID=A0AAD3SZD8_NEPGR|nr:hypothetical protein Nepgr_021860 [Nepenthes gracilis]
MTYRVILLTLCVVVSAKSTLHAAIRSIPAGNSADGASRTAEYSAESAPTSSSESLEIALFDVSDYGGIGDAKTDSTEAFLSAWADACKYPGTSTLLIPNGTFHVGPISFEGPCYNNKAPQVEIRGSLRAPSSLSAFPEPTWILFQDLRGLALTGSGGAAVLDGQGEAAWADPTCGERGKRTALPRSIRFQNVSDGIISNITLLNSKGFHVSLLHSYNVTVHGLNIIAPWDSPNTDGIHVGESTNITISSSTIGVGDDCVSVGPGSFNISIFNITCGPGHGISVGSLGRKENENNVAGIAVRNCTINSTQNGVRVKTWPASPRSSASDMIFQDIIMINVSNPIIIDQEYCPSENCAKSKASYSSWTSTIFNEPSLHWRAFLHFAFAFGDDVEWCSARKSCWLRIRRIMLRLGVK